MLKSYKFYCLLMWAFDFKGRYDDHDDDHDDVHDDHDHDFKAARDQPFQV